MLFRSASLPADAGAAAAAADAARRPHRGLAVEPGGHHGRPRRDAGAGRLLPRGGHPPGVGRDLPWHLLRPARRQRAGADRRSEEHTSELQSLMRISYAVFCLNTKKTKYTQNKNNNTNTIQTH